MRLIMLRRLTEFTPRLQRMAIRETRFLGLLWEVGIPATLLSTDPFLELMEIIPLQTVGHSASRTRQAIRLERIQALTMLLRREHHLARDTRTPSLAWQLSSRILRRLGQELLALATRRLRTHHTTSFPTMAVQRISSAGHYYEWVRRMMATLSRRPAHTMHD